MARRTNPFDWDQLLDGKIHTLDLDDYPTFDGGLDTVRALAYRQAERRRHTVNTHKLDPTKLQIQAHEIKPPCRRCGVPAGQGHRLDCFQARLREEEQRQAAKQQQLDVNVPTSVLQDPDASDDDLLLGPCSCGQAPACQPHCIRVAGA